MINVHCGMFLQAVSTSSLPFRIVEDMYSCFIIAGNHQECVTIVPELEREPGKNDCESNSLTNKLARLILSGSSDINSI